MSHFTVLVVTDWAPSESLLGEILQPWHEFETTGINDQHVIGIDKTDHYRSEYAKYLESEDGKENPLTMIRYLEEWEGVQVVREGGSVDLADEHKYGYAIVDNSDNLVFAVRMTNPNSRWDWWTVGGRWKGMLKVRNQEEGVDSCQVQDLDFESMIKSKIQSRTNNLTTALSQLSEKGICPEEAILQWNAYVENLPVITAEWKAKPELKDTRLWDYIETFENPCRTAKESGVLHAFDDFFGVGIPDTEGDPWKWTKDVSPITCFAYVKDGHWYTNGEMGWWAHVSGEAMTEQKWREHVTEMIQALPATAYLTFVDCHI